MAIIKPFKGILYNQEKIENLDLVVAPPYDVISSVYQEELYNMSDHNVVRLILGKKFETDNDRNNRYTRSSEYLDDWLKKGVLRQNGFEGFYFYIQKYFLNGEEKSRVGFIARLKLEEFDKGIVCPHEFTLSKPKEDRLKLTRACRANFSQVFSLFSDPEKIIDRLIEKEITEDNLTNVKDSEGTVHSFGSISNKDVIEQLVYNMKDKKVYIADGHHRYETALEYRDEMREKQGKITGNEPFDYVMMFLTNMESEGTSIFPIHRLLCNLNNFQQDQFLKSLKTYFSFQEFQLNNPSEKESVCANLLQLMEVKGKNQFTFGLYFGTGSFYLLLLKDKSVLNNLADNSKPREFIELEVFILHSLIIEKIMGINKESIKNQENICYKKSEKEAVAMVDSGEYQMAFFLNPTRMDQVKKIAGAGERMPQKSTFFFPKLLSGLVINPLTR